MTTVGAPFPYHMFTFHSDGTMLQSNPPAGNKDTSDTAGMGVWEERKGQIVARFEEYRLDYQDGTVTRGAIDFDIKVNKDALSGSCTFTVYNAESGALIHGPHPATLTGERVRLP